VILFVFVCGCEVWRLLKGILRDEVGVLRAVVMGAHGEASLRAVIVLCCVSSLTFFCGFRHRGGECGMSRLELCLARFFVSVLSRGSVVC
jgi:hypothetical protein